MGISIIYEIASNTSTIRKIATKSITIRELATKTSMIHKKTNTVRCDANLRYNHGSTAVERACLRRNQAVRACLRRESMERAIVFAANAEMG